MKKSKSSNPLLLLNALLPALFPDFPADVAVAIAVGKTNEGESFPAKPNLVKPVPLSMTTAGVPIDAILH